jgi:hypothetical protein
MKLYLLLPVGGRFEWIPWYDKAFGFVIRAATESEARRIAQADAGDEVRSGVAFAEEDVGVWTDPRKTSCEELAHGAGGLEGVLLRDFRSA